MSFIRFVCLAWVAHLFIAAYKHPSVMRTIAFFITAAIFTRSSVWARHLSIDL